MNSLSLSSSKTEPKVGSWVQEDNLGDFQEAGGRSGGSCESREGEKAKKDISVGNWCSFLQGP